MWKHQLSHLCSCPRQGLKPRLSPKTFEDAKPKTIYDPVVAMPSNA